MLSFPTQLSRRHAFHSAAGLGGLALASLLREHGQTAEESAPARASIRPRVKRVIWLFMHGGPSHVDLFDPKPDLIKLAGKPLPDSFGEVATRRKVATNPLLPPIKAFRSYGQSGLPISDFLPETAQLADDLCIIRSLHGDSVNHPVGLPNEHW